MATDGETEIVEGGHSDRLGAVIEVGLGLYGRNERANNNFPHNHTRRKYLTFFKLFYILIK
jgi:hypothetical protein